jgi:hypothetical protein
LTPDWLGEALHFLRMSSTFACTYRSKISGFGTRRLLKNPRDMRGFFNRVGHYGNVGASGPLER